MSGLRVNKSAQRSLAVFELFSDRMIPLSVGEVSKALEIPQPSASVLLRNLTSMGYLHHNPETRKFVPTLRVLLLGSWIESRFTKSGDIAEELKRLQPELGETLMIGVQNSGRAQYILANEPQQPDRLLVRSGMLRSLLRSAVGRALLALKSDAEIAGWVRRCNAEEASPESVVPAASFFEIIRLTRERGYAETAGDVTPGFGTIAMTFASPMDSSPMAIACGMSLGRMEEKKEMTIAALRQFVAKYPFPVAS